MKIYKNRSNKNYKDLNYYKLNTTNVTEYINSIKPNSLDEGFTNIELLIDRKIYDVKQDKVKKRPGNVLPHPNEYEYIKSLCSRANIKTYMDIYKLYISSPSRLHEDDGHILLSNDYLKTVIYKFNNTKVHILEHFYNKESQGNNLKGKASSFSYIDINQRDMYADNLKYKSTEKILEILYGITKGFISKEEYTNYYNSQKSIVRASKKDLEIAESKVNLKKEIKVEIADKIIDKNTSPEEILALIPNSNKKSYEEIFKIDDEFNREFIKNKVELDDYSDLEYEFLAKTKKVTREVTISTETRTKLYVIRDCTLRGIEFYEESIKELYDPVHDRSIVTKINEMNNIIKVLRRKYNELDNLIRYIIGNKLILVTSVSISTGREYNIFTRLGSSIRKIALENCVSLDVSSMAICGIINALNLKEENFPYFVNFVNARDSIIETLSNELYSEYANIRGIIDENGEIIINKRASLYADLRNLIKVSLLSIFMGSKPDFRFKDPKCFVNESEKYIKTKFVSVPYIRNLNKEISKICKINNIEPKDFASIFMKKETEFINTLKDILVKHAKGNYNIIRVHDELLAQGFFSDKAIQEIEELLHTNKYIVKNINQFYINKIIDDNNQSLPRNYKKIYNVKKVKVGSMSLDYFISKGDFIYCTKSNIKKAIESNLISEQIASTISDYSYSDPIHDILDWYKLDSIEVKSKSNYSIDPDEWNIDSSDIIDTIDTSIQSIIFIKNILDFIHLTKQHNSNNSRNFSKTFTKDIKVYDKILKIPISGYT